MDNKTRKQGQEYSDNVIDSMEDILNIKDEEDKQEEIFNYGLSISKETVINYLISWGGPAYRLQITFNEDKALLSIKPQYQDWFTEWTSATLTNEQQEQLNNYCATYFDAELFTDHIL